MGALLHQPFLTAGDLQALAAEPSAEGRATIARKVSDAAVAGQLTPAERDLATAIFAVLAHDAEVLVRRRLAECLSYHADPPQAIVRDLIFDAVEVASPLLETSLALSDGDLMSVIDRCSREHARAIARRQSVSAPVSGALAATGDETVVTDLLRNAGAQIAEPTYHLIVDSFGGLPRIMDLVSLREVLPAAIIERIVTAVSDDARRRLSERCRISAAELDTLMLHAREHMLLTVTLADRPADELAAALLALYPDRPISATLMLRAAMVGNFGVLAAGLACTADLRHEDALQLLLQPRDGVCERLYDRCALPVQYRALFSTVMALARRFLYTGDKRQRGPFQTRVHRWGASVLGVPENRIGFDQMITRLLARAPMLELREFYPSLIGS